VAAGLVVPGLTTPVLGVSPAEVAGPVETNLTTTLVGLHGASRFSWAVAVSGRVVVGGYDLYGGTVRSPTTSPPPSRVAVAKTDLLDTRVAENSRRITHTASCGVVTGDYVTAPAELQRKARQSSGGNADIL
jgi:hypothetical protein